MSDFLALQDQLGFSFGDQALLALAFTHKSYRNENPDRVSDDNERLEFLGDTVLSLMISEALLSRYPDHAEGDLSKMRAKIVSTPTLASIALEMCLGQFLLLGAGEEKSGGREKESLLADALEALIAAVYLDLGLSVAKQFVLKSFSNCLNNLDSNGFSDYKTELQEQSQKQFGVLPTYHLISELGPEHQKQFEVEVRILDIAYGASFGKSKKEAQQQAAQIALRKLTEV